MIRRPAALARRTSPAAALLAGVLACASHPAPGGAGGADDLNNATSVPAAAAGAGGGNTGLPTVGTGASAGNTVSTPGSNSNQLGVVGSPNLVGPMFVSPYGQATPTCLSAASDTPADGSQVALVACSDVPAQRWLSDRGRLVGQNNMCLTNLGANATTANPPAGDQLAAVLTACNANALDVRQHVELQFGALMNVTGPSTFALGVVQNGNGVGQLSWANYDPNATSQAYSCGALPQASNAVSGASSPSRGFAVRISGTSSCLDANAGGASAVGVAACDAAAAGQAWSLDVYGQLQNAGRCLNASGGTLTLPTCGQATPAQQWQANYGQLIGATRCLTAASAAGGAAALVACDNTASTWSFGQRP